jgi:hypothetical protein
VINPSEAKALYDSYDSAVHLGNLQTGLIGHWKLDGNAKDSSPHAYDGASGGTTPVADREGSSGAAMSFTGDSSSYIQITNFDNTVLTPSHFNATWTMSIWAKSGTNANERVLLGKQGCNGGIYTYNGKYVFAIKGSACWTGAQTIYGSALDANWHLLTATYSAGAMAFYEDGVLQGTATLANMNNYGNDLGIGNTNGGHGYGFNGALDDARIYNRVLSVGEIQQLYDSYNSQINLGGGSSGSSVNLVKGLVGYWPFNGNAKDATPYANDGTVNGATLTGDRFGKTDSAYQLGNANAYISIGTPSIFSGLTSSGFTYSIWLMRQDVSTYHWPEIMGSSNTHVYYGVRSNNYGDGIYFEYGKSPYDGSSFAATTNNSLPVGQWHMFTVTYDGTTLNTYWDGVSKTSTGAALNPASFGFLFSNSSADWNGSIDDARVYNRPLTAAEVQALYNL